MPPKPRSNPEKILLVEGPDDEQVVYRLRDHAGIPENAFSVVPFGGYPKLAEQLPRELKASELKYLGVIVDADLSLASRWQSLSDQFKKSSYILPPQPQQNGTVIPGLLKPTIGLWVMPNNQISGILEDFISHLIPDNDDLWPLAQNTVNQILGQQRRFADNKTSKSQIHTWLAWQKEPGRPLGQAIMHKYLDAQSVNAQQLIDWLKRLFALS